MDTEIERENAKRQNKRMRDRLAQRRSRQRRRASVTTSAAISPDDDKKTDLPDQSWTSDMLSALHYDYICMGPQEQDHGNGPNYIVNGNGAPTLVPYGTMSRSAMGPDIAFNCRSDWPQSHTLRREIYDFDVANGPVFKHTSDPAAHTVNPHVVVTSPPLLHTEQKGPTTAESTFEDEGRSGMISSSRPSFARSDLLFRSPSAIDVLDRHRFLIDSPARSSDRITQMLALIRQLGFESFDEAVVFYYTADASASHTIQQTQRISRRRRLRLVLSAIHETSKSWSAAEANGVKEETAKAAEDIYIAEAKRLQESGRFCHISIAPLIAGFRDFMNRIESSEEIRSCAIVAQDEAPELTSLFDRLITTLGEDDESESLVVVANEYES